MLAKCVRNTELCNKAYLSINAYTIILIFSPERRPHFSSYHLWRYGFNNHRYHGDFDSKYVKLVAPAGSITNLAFSINKNIVVTSSPKTISNKFFNYFKS